MTPREARRIALAAQGFRKQPRDKPATWAKLAVTIDEMHLLQIDSVNVLTRSHYLPLFSTSARWRKPIAMSLNAGRMKPASCPWLCIRLCAGG